MKENKNVQTAKYEQLLFARARARKISMSLVKNKKALIDILALCQLKPARQPTRHVV
jgi:hypothetical protein